jgi:dephospho-CoA kinase
MEPLQHEQYEYARRRLRQKKNFYFHFVLFLVGTLFMFIANVLLKFGQPYVWYIWASTAWFFVIILHFIKVFITDRFMNIHWERQQIERLMEKQRIKISQLETKVASQAPKSEE